MESESTPRTGQSRTGLKRPNYGPMKYRVFKKYPTTPHTKRRTILDDSVLEALHQTHIGPLSSYNGGTSNVGHNDEADIESAEQLNDKPKDIQPEFVGDDNQKWPFDSSVPQYMPQTPKRDSRSFVIAPGSGRRTPRRRSRSSGQFQRTTPLKALADANQARVNRLINEASRRGRVGRDKHSPMGIMRLLSRLPGFNPSSDSQLDRQQIPGSANWRKLTPKSSRTNYIQMSDDPSNPSAQNTRHSLNVSSKRQERDMLSSAERLAFEKFKDQNPFLDPDEFYKLWDDELGVTREGGRISFGLGESGGNYALTDDGDTREFVTQGELVDPFTVTADGIETRPLHIGDITNTSQHGYLGEHEQAGQNKSTTQTYERHDRLYYQSTDGNTYVEFEQELNESSLYRSSVQASQQSSEDADIESVGQSQSEISDAAERSSSISNTIDGKRTLQQEGDVDMEDGWEDILDEENEVQGSTSNHQVLETISTDGGNSNIESSNVDLPMTDQNNLEDLETLPFPGEEESYLTEPVNDNSMIPHDDLAEEEEAVDNGDRNDQAVPENEQQLEDEDGYINDEEHIEQQEHNERDRPGVHFFDDFPSEIGIMSSGQVLPTSLPVPKKAVRLSAAGIPVPSMPTLLQKQLVNTFSRSRISREAMSVIMEGSHQFFEQASNDLAAYATHAGRRTIDESDVECLMKRLRITNDKVSMESLLQRYLPRELRDKVLYPDDMKSFRRG